MGASSGEVVVRPRRSRERTRSRLYYVLPIVPLTVIGLMQVFAANPGNGAWLAAGLAAFAALCYAITVDFYTQTSLGVVGSTVRRTGYLGRSASCPREQVARVVEVTVVFTRFFGIPARWLLFLDPADRTLMRAYAEYYPPDELNRFRAALGLRWEGLPGIRTFPQLRRDLPGSVPWAMAHYWLTALGFCVVAYLVAVVVVTIV